MLKSLILTINISKTTKTKPMGIITRFLPDSTPTRLQVLTVAKEKKDSLDPSQNILSAGTTTRLDELYPLFVGAINKVATRKGESTEATDLKIESGKELRLYISHFLHVFNMAVLRKVYPPSARAFFNLDVSTGNLPDIASDTNAELAATTIAAGALDLASHAMPPMVNPSAEEVAAKLGIFKTAYAGHSNKAQELDAAQEALDALTPEADKVIKKIYDEVETHYNEEEPESMRADCKWWGVIYRSIGEETQVTVVLRSKADSTPLAGKGIKLVQAAGKILVTDADGQVQFTTRVNGNADLTVYSNPDNANTAILKQEIMIEETIPLTVVIEI